MTYFLDLDDALEQIHFLGFHVRDVGLLQSSLARPNTTLYGADAYPSLDLKAAALMHSIVTSHPLIDGNKRTAWALMITFVLLNGFEVVAETDDAFDFVLGVATESAELDSIASWIAAHRAPYSL
ncbi:MAG: type II toxin-antitoxin system death-on-curing family toxin [Pontimonas sp.]